MKFLLKPIFVWKYKFSFESIKKIDGPFLVFANHNLNLDPVLVGIASKRQLYFVAGEHVFRAGFASKLLQFFLAPISRPKGAGAVSTVLSVKRVLSTGAGVCIFVEGNRSWDGVTGEHPEGTAYLAKSSKAHLVNLRISGGYLTSPRWSKKSRRGRTHLSVAGVYSPRQLADMSLEEVESVIKNDLFEDAYARQREKKEIYKGKDLAEYMECLFFACPKCKKCGSMESKGDVFFCRHCGVEMKYDTSGYLQGLDFETVTEYAEWQWKYAFELIEKGDFSFLSDPDASLYEVGADHSQKEISRGSVSFDPECLRVGEIELLTRDIKGMQVYYRNSIALTCGKKYYMLTFGSPRANAIKYERAHGIFSKQNFGLTSNGDAVIIRT